MRGCRSGGEPSLKKPWLEKIMSKSNDTSKLGHATPDDHGPLADSELDAVSGGMIIQAAAVRGNNNG